VEAGALICSYHNFAAGHAFGFGDLIEDDLAALERLLGILEEEFAGSGERDAASRAVEQASAYFFFEGANLGGDGGLRAKTLLRCAGEAGEARYFEEDL